MVTSKGVRQDGATGTPGGGRRGGLARRVNGIIPGAVEVSGLALQGLAEARKMAPPPSKRVVVITSASVSVDWLTSVGVKFDGSIKGKQRILGHAVGSASGFADKSLGMKGFSRAMVGPEGVLVAWEGRGDAGNLELVQASGKAWAAMGSRQRWLLRRIKQFGYCEHATRLDLQATFLVPDDSPLLPENLRAAEMRGELVTNAEKRRCIDSRTPQGHPGEGVTYYIGSGVSQCSVRVYRAAATHPELVDPFGFVWVRVEMQFRHEFADQVQDTLIETPQKDWGEVLAGLLGRFAKFKVVTGDSNATRRPLMSFWSEFLGGVSALRLKRWAPLWPDDSGYAKWRRGVADSAAAVSLAVDYGGDVDAFGRHLSDLLQRFKAPQLEKLAIAGLLG